MSVTTAPPAGNVTPMWGGAPPQRPWPQPPSCYSQLYGLNQCYDDVMMMQQILMKVICDMAANNAAFQKCLAEGIAAGGSSVPLVGVTNGSQAQPGQVGEYLTWSGSGTIPQAADQAQVVSTLVVPPGDWDVESSVVIVGGFTTFSYNIGTAGGSATISSAYAASSQGYSVTGGPPDIPSGWESLTAPRVQFNVSVPTLLTFAVITNVPSASTGPGTFNMFVTLRRMR